MFKLTALCMAMVAAAMSLAGEYEAKISADGVYIAKDGLPLSLFSRVIAVEPPWGEKYFFSAWCNPASERTELADGGVKFSMIPRTQPDKVKFEEYSATVYPDRVEILLALSPVNAVPFCSEYSALMIPERLVRDSTLAVNGGKPAPLPAKWVPRVRTLAENVARAVFDTKLGTYTVDVLEGPPVSVVDRRGFGFDVGTETDTPGIWIGEFGENHTTPYRVRLRVAFTPAEGVVMAGPLPKSGEITGAPTDRLVRMPEQTPTPLPAVKKLVMRSETPLPEANFVLHIQNVTPEDTARLAKTAALRLPSVAGAPERPINASIDTSLNPEQYTLKHSAAEVTVTAGSARGVYYALQTLANYRRTDCAIEDWPDLSWRGVLIMVDKDSLRVHGEMIEKLFGPGKLNHLFIECEYVAWDATRNVRPAWAMSKEDLAKLIDIAHDNFMEVTPLFQTLGHCEWLFANGQNRELAENRGLSVYNVRHPSVHPLMEKVLDEVVALFKPQYLHIGHDEVGTEASYPEIAANRAEGGAKLILDDVMFYYDYCRKHHIRMMMWQDMFVRTDNVLTNSGTSSYFGLAEKRLALPRDIVFAFWNYGDTIDERSYADLRKEGFDVIGCSWFSPVNNKLLCDAAKKYSGLGLMVTTWAGYNGFAGIYDDNPYQVAAYITGAARAWDRSDAANVFSPGNELNLRIFPALADPENPGEVMDLSSVANLQLSKTGVPFMFEPDMDYPAMASKPMNCAIKFKLAERDGAPAVVTVKSWLNPKFPETVVIPLDRTATRLYVLNSMRSPDRKISYGNRVATMTARYSDGTVAEIPICYGHEVGLPGDDYTPDLAKFRCFEWTLPDGSPVRNWYFRWDNPTPGKKIAELEVAAAGNCPYYILGLAVQ